MYMRGIRVTLIKGNASVKGSYTTENLCFPLFEIHIFSCGGRVSQITFAQLQQLTYIFRDVSQLLLIRKEKSGKAV